MNKAKIICLMNQKGGVGKSTVATNIAAELSKLYKVILVDCDPQGSCNGFANERREILGERNDLTVCSIEYKKGENTSDIKFAGDVQNSLSTFKNNYDIIVLDTPGKNDIVSRALASESDLVIVPINPGLYDAWASDDTFTALVGFMIYRKELRSRILINRLHPNTILSEMLKEFTKKTEIKPFNTTLGERTIYGQSAGGLSVVEIDHKSEAAKELEELVFEIESELEIEPSN